MSSSFAHALAYTSSATLQTVAYIQSSDSGECILLLCTNSSCSELPTYLFNCDKNSKVHAVSVTHEAKKEREGERNDSQAVWSSTVPLHSYQNAKGSMQTEGNMDTLKAERSSLRTCADW